MDDSDPRWTFDIVGGDSEALDENGVEIVVEDLTPGAERSFSDPGFIQNLRRTIARDYSLHLNRGLRMKINGDNVVGLQLKLRESKDFAPLRFEYTDQSNDSVIVEILGGMASEPPENVEPDERPDGDKRFGWYVGCNGRIVLAADKTSVSGWGTPDWPQWHPQYSGFVGVVLFISPNAADLPLTTTKRSVDVTSAIFLRARSKMREVSKEWIAYTNIRKQALEEAKKKEAETIPVSIYEVKKRDSVTLPKLIPVPAARVANVHYAVPISKMKKLATKFGSVNMSYRDVGLRSFDYAYEDMVGDV